jgi:hypothetical protein
LPELCGSWWRAGLCWASRDGRSGLRAGHEPGAAGRGDGGGGRAPGRAPPAVRPALAVLRDAVLPHQLPPARGVRRGPARRARGLADPGRQRRPR